MSEQVEQQHIARRVENLENSFLPFRRQTIENIIQSLPLARAMKKKFSDLSGDSEVFLPLRCIFAFLTHDEFM